jgi:hypothetical protein
VEVGGVIIVFKVEVAPTAQLWALDSLR